MPDIILRYWQTLSHLICLKTQFQYYVLREAFPGCSEVATVSCSMVAFATTWNLALFALWVFGACLHTVLAYPN